MAFLPFLARSFSPRRPDTGNAEKTTPTMHDTTLSATHTNTRCFVLRFSLMMMMMMSIIVQSGTAHVRLYIMNANAYARPFPSFPSKKSLDL
jgi:hypothetical protein